MREEGRMTTPAGLAPGSQAPFGNPIPRTSASRFGKRTFLSVRSERAFRNEHHRRAHAKKPGRLPRSPSAPKGRYTKAQGNALGKRVGNTCEALKGRDSGFAKRIFRPFGACDPAMDLSPSGLVEVQAHCQRRNTSQDFSAVDGHGVFPSPDRHAGGVFWICLSRCTKIQSLLKSTPSERKCSPNVAGIITS